MIGCDVCARVFDLINANTQVTMSPKTPNALDEFSWLAYLLLAGFSLVQGDTRGGLIIALFRTWFVKKMSILA